MSINVYRHGKLISLWEAATRSGIAYATLYRRYHAGIRGADLFTAQRRGRPVKHKIKYKGKRYSPTELAKLKGVAVATIYSQQRRKKAK